MFSPFLIFFLPFIIKYTFVCLYWQWKDFTALLELALIMMTVQMGDCFLGLGIYIILLFSWLGTASSSRLLLCSIMSLSSFSSLSWTWLGICLGSWILPWCNPKASVSLHNLTPRHIWLSKCSNGCNRHSCLYGTFSWACWVQKSWDDSSVQEKGWKFHLATESLGMFYFTNL